MTRDVSGGLIITSKTNFVLLRFALQNCFDIGRLHMAVLDQKLAYSCRESFEAFGKSNDATEHFSPKLFARIPVGDLRHKSRRQRQQCCELPSYVFFEAPKLTDVTIKQWERQKPLVITDVPEYFLSADLRLLYKFAQCQGVSCRNFYLVLKGDSERSGVSGGAFFFPARLIVVDPYNTAERAGAGPPAQRPGLPEQ